MDSDVTYADLKFPTISQTAEKGAGTTKISQKQNKTSAKIAIASALVIFFLLLSALIALIILYSRVSTRLLSTEQRMGQLQGNYSQLLKNFNCDEESSDCDCRQFFAESCPDRWVLNNSRCYFFSNSSSSWQDSQNNCHLRGSDLVVISDGNEQEFITNRKKLNLFYWIGLTDNFQNGQWKWVNGSQLVTGFWHCSQPDNNRDEYCATVGILPCNTAQSLNNWNDDTCTKAHMYICEKEAHYVRRE